MTSPTILLTGASQGLGLACASVLLTKFRCNVVTLSRSLPDGLSKLQERYKENLVVVQGDVTSEIDCKHALKAANDTFGRLDGLILNAGVLEPISKIADCDLEQARRLFEVNFLSLFTLLKNAIPSLRSSHGRVIFVSSGAAKSNYIAWGAYGASKAAMNHLAATLAKEEPDITSISVRPGVLDTDMQKLIRDTGGQSMSREEHAKFTSLHSESKLTNPEEPAHVIASLALEAARSMSGEFVSWDDSALQAHRR